MKKEFYQVRCKVDNHDDVNSDLIPLDTGFALPAVVLTLGANTVVISLLTWSVMNIFSIVTDCYYMIGW